MRTANQGSERDIAYHYRESNQRSCVLQQLEEQVQHRPVTNLIKNIEGKYGPFDAYAYLSFNEEKGIYQVNLEVDKATSKK